MDIVSLLFIAFGMALDAFAVCLSAGTLPKIRGPRPAFRLSFHFGLFQAIMPIIGWFAGVTIERYITNYAHWVAFGLLAFVGIRMVRAGLSRSDEVFKTDPSRGWTLVMLSLAVSVDALAVGLSLGVLNVTIWIPALVIGLVTGALSLVGLYVGQQAGIRFGKPVEILGGVLLLGIGMEIVIEHLVLH